MILIPPKFNVVDFLTVLMLVCPNLSVLIKLIKLLTLSISRYDVGIFVHFVNVCKYVKKLHWGSMTRSFLLQ